MTTTTHPDQDKRTTLIKAVLYPFSMDTADDGAVISLKGLVCSDIFDEIKIGTINAALEIAQEAALIAWDDNRIGAIKLTPTGLNQLASLHAEFLDADKNTALKKQIKKIHATDFQKTASLPLMQSAFTGDIALPGESCPKTGNWCAPNLQGKVVWLKEGEIMPGEQFSLHGNAVIWYLKV